MNAGYGYAITVVPKWEGLPIQVLQDKQGNWVMFDVGLALANRGKGIARDIYMNCTVSGVGPYLEVQREATDKRFSGGHAFGFITNLISSGDFRLAPEGFIQPIVLHVKMKPPFNAPFSIGLSVGAEGQMPMKGTISRTEEELAFLYKEVMAGRSDSFMERFLKVDTDRSQ